MIVDSSALLAILQLEPEAERLARAVARDSVAGFQLQIGWKQALWYLFALVRDRFRFPPPATAAATVTVSGSFFRP